MFLRKHLALILLFSCFILNCQIYCNECAASYVIDEAASVAASLLSEKFSARYEHEYAAFKKWQKENNVVGVTEDFVLAYINNLSYKFNLNSLWLKWSMVKSCLAVRENIDVSRFHKVAAFLKIRNERYVPLEAKILTKELVEKCIEAPDEKWMLAKVIAMFGLFGCCRCDELLSLSLNDLDKYIVVTLRDTKNFTTTRFTITDDGCSFKPCTIYRKYAALRPQKSKDLRLFLTYRNGKCVALNAGQNTIDTVYIRKSLNILDYKTNWNNCIMIFHVYDSNKAQFSNVNKN